MISFYEKKFNLFNDLNFKIYKKNVKSVLLKCGGAYVTTIGVACASNDVNNNMTLGELKNQLVETTFFNEPMPTKQLLHNCKQVIINKWDYYNLSTLLENVPLAQEVDVKNFLDILRTDPNVQKLIAFNSENFEEDNFFRAIDLICKKTAEKQYETFQQLQSESIDNEEELKLLYSNKKTIKAVRTEKHNKERMRPSIKIMSLITSIYNNLRAHKFFSEYDFIEIINTYNNNLPEEFKNHYRLECNVKSAHSSFLRRSLLTVSFS